MIHCAGETGCPNRRNGTRPSEAKLHEIRVMYMKIQQRSARILAFEITGLAPTRRRD